MRHHIVEIAKIIALPDGMVVDLRDTLAKKELYGKPEHTRNIRLYDKDGQLVWQVYSDFDSSGDPYTNIWYDDGILYAYRWDGGEYIIDIDTGFAKPFRLVK